MMVFISNRNCMFRPIGVVFSFWQLSYYKSYVYNIHKPRVDVEISSPFTCVC